jgi:hypothetical protein
MCLWVLYEALQDPLQNVTLFEAQMYVVLLLVELGPAFSLKVGGIFFALLFHFSRLFQTE